MNNFIMYSIALLSVIIVIVMLIKKMDIKITMFAMGTVLMYIAIFTGNTIGGDSFQSSGLTLLDPLLVIINEFKSSLNAAGFIIMILGGYTSYMSAIGANEVTVHTLTKPIKKIKSIYILVPVVFLIGNLLSLVIPSASNLAIILLATLYPILRQAGMTPLTTAAVIATTATVMPRRQCSDCNGTCKISRISWINSIRLCVEISCNCFSANTNFHGSCALHLAKTHG